MTQWTCTFSIDNHWGFGSLICITTLIIHVRIQYFTTVLYFLHSRYFAVVHCCRTRDTTVLYYIIDYHSIYCSLICIVSLSFKLGCNTLLIQALTTPLARLPEIARNGRRATVFVGWSCPPNLYLTIRATSVLLRQTAAHSTPYTLLFLRGNLRGDCQIQLISVRDLNDLISIVFNLII